jgi:hypothetical protein
MQTSIQSSATSLFYEKVPAIHTFGKDLCMHNSNGINCFFTGLDDQIKTYILQSR